MYQKLDPCLQMVTGIITTEYPSIFRMSAECLFVMMLTRTTLCFDIFFIKSKQTLAFSLKPVQQEKSDVTFYSALLTIQKEATLSLSFV